MGQAKDGFSSLHCLQHSSLDGVFVSVTHADSFAEKPCDDLGYRPAQLRKNVNKRNTHKSQFLTTSRAKQPLTSRRTSLPMPGARCRSVGHRLRDVHLSAEAQVGILSMRVGSGTSCAWLYLFVHGMIMACMVSSYHRTSSYYHKRQMTPQYEVPMRELKSSTKKCH